MSCFVKYMDEPEECKWCDFKECRDDLGDEWCPVLGELRAWRGKLKDCPVKELPDVHGRLIDADEAIIHIVKVVQKYFKSIYGDNTYEHSDIYEIIENAIDEVPEIIEAEE